MKYADARDLIASGDVIFQSHRPMRSWYDLQIQIVRAFTRSEWSHTGIAWVVAGRVFIIEAVGSGVRIFPLSRAGDFTWMHRRPGLSAAQEEFALAQVGKRYGKLDALRSFFGASDATDGRWFCSELVCAVLGLPVAEQTPAQVMRYLSEAEGLAAQFVKNES